MGHKEFLDKEGLTYYNGKLKLKIDAKQDTINDLETIRTGAGLGATALQSVPSSYAQKTDLPTKTSDLTNDSGFISDGELSGVILSENQPTDPAYALWIEESDLNSSGGDPIPVDIIDVGTIVPYSGVEAPKNWLICDGRAISRATYIELFNVIGTTYGDGDGSTTFNLPDLKGKVLAGLDSSQTEFNTIGKTGGEKTHNLTVDEMPSHKHDLRAPSSSIAASGGNIGNEFVVSDTQGKSLPKWTVATGGDQSHNNLQPYIVINYIIKYHREIITNLTASVEDTLASNSTTNALSANQGKILNETKVSSTSIKNIEMVTEYPTNPNPNTLYIRVEE